jgi:hypothetical protein
MLDVYLHLEARILIVTKLVLHFIERKMPGTLKKYKSYYNYE